ncbi:hypothetical protein [Streptomyces fuscichromogenes]|uniref:Uncharacterized protein n=1 Tax=Streptomyces fuscichromogenes TaxID=1324013 RepID=A0A917XKW5_9ACTN|nr:hypothetical protein [Streptomyces fuscichromogenes]GGN33208.1 hypothetical protein GCM10011578_072840 [Streptomyces fuscichromogenes]
MEQRIGANSQPLEGAGFDPAFIPGLTSPAAAEPKDARPEEKAEDVEAAAEPVAVAEAEATADAAADEAADGEETSEETPEGPAFEAADRRARIVADHQGVRLSLDEEKCEFRWDEIGAIETEAPRFGKRFTITVHTPDRRWYPIEIEATSRSRFKEWEEQLDEVLDAYFDDGEKAEAAPEPDAEDKPEDKPEDKVLDEE